MALNTAKAVEVMFENALETFDTQTQMLDLIDVFTPNSGDLQNTGNNTIWRPVQQHAPVKEGWTIYDQGDAPAPTPENPNPSEFGNVIELYYPSTLGNPLNDAFTLRADNLRDMSFWERRGVQSGKRQSSYLNNKLADLIVTQGAIYQNVSSAMNGYDFIGNAQTILNERQVASDERTFVLNERDRQMYAADLAQRGTLSGRPEDSYRTGMIGSEVAQFDVYSGSYIPRISGSTVAITATVDGNVDNRPIGFQLRADQSYGNVDYREGSVTVSTGGGAQFAVGDRITFTNSGVGVQSIGLDDKTVSGQPMTFVVRQIVGDVLTVYPKPIALTQIPNNADDPFTPEQASFANTDTQILDGATITRLNNFTSQPANIFWAKDSIEIIGGDAPITLLSEFAGQKVISSSLKSGLNMYMAYDGNINDLTFKCRIFTWWGLVNKNPMANGVLVRS